MWESKLGESNATALDLTVTSKEKKINTTQLIKVCGMKGLVSLNLSGHSLKEIPDEIVQLADLEKLDLSKNELKSLGSVANLPKLKELSVKLNQFPNFPKELGKLNHLERLDISFNNIKQLQFGIDLPNLLTPKKVTLPPLKHLNLSYNELNKFPMKIFEFKGLASLELARNSFGDDIPKDIIKFQDSMTNLVLDEVGMTKFPPEVLHLLGLERLSISKNAIKELPTVDRMLNLSSLKEFYANSCEILRWAPLTLLCKLQVLHLNDNNIQSIPYEAKHLLQLKELKMSKNQIQDIPKHIEFLFNLEVCDFSFNKIESIDPAIGKLSCLKIINLSNNQLKCLPEDMSLLENIEELDVSMNKISEMPNVSKWGVVKNLILKNNRMGSIPAGVGKCRLLESLDMTMNCVRKIDEVFGLPSLSLLRLKHNGIEIIPKEIATLKNLVDLNLDNNAVLEIPVEITQLEKLKNLNLSYNSPTGHKLSSEVKAWIEKNGVVITQEFEFASKILEGIYLGSAAAASNKHHLKELGITHIVTVAHDIPAPHPELLSYLMVYVEDIRAATLLPHFDDINRFIDEARSKNQGVLIHCMAGRSRSATVTCSYLMYHKRMKVKDAYAAMKKARSIVDPNETFKKELKSYEKYLNFEKEVFKAKNPWELINVPLDSELHRIYEMDMIRLKMPKFCQEVTVEAKKESTPTKGKVIPESKSESTETGSQSQQ